MATNESDEYIGVLCHRSCLFGEVILASPSGMLNGGSTSGGKPPGLRGSEPGGDGSYILETVSDLE